jgi:nucleoside-diphosphate-sugar epimerase
VKVVVFGATGNVGTSLVRTLAGEPAVDAVLGVARRAPQLDVAKTEWAEADVATSDLVPLLRGADAVVHLAWRIQPSRDLNALWRTNVTGSTRVFGAAAAAGVRTLVYASSVGVYSPGPKDRLVEESWPRHGISTAFYSRHKAEVERRLDELERAAPDLRVVRLRPGLIFKREAATGIRRLFAGPFLPSPLLRRQLALAVPNVPQLRFQAVHTDDVADAYRRALVRDEARGAYNIAAEPVLDPPRLARLARAPLVPVPAGAVRAATAATWRLRLQPSPPGWVDMALQVPLLDSARAQHELGWTPARRADEALLELLEGMRERAGDRTPPLAAETSGPLRVRELASAIGGRDVR